MNCPTCGQDYPGPCPPEPPVGTWVKDKHGTTHVRTGDRWAPAPTGFFALGVWSAIWEASGPLVICAPWGREEVTK